MEYTKMKNDDKYFTPDIKKEIYDYINKEIKIQLIYLCSINKLKFLKIDNFFKIKRKY